LKEVTVEDKRLVMLDAKDAVACLESNSGVLAILTEAWEKQLFKEVRKLGTLIRL
jgi:hypothetical protein